MGPRRQHTPYMRKPITIKHYAKHVSLFFVKGTVCFMFLVGQLRSIACWAR